MVISITGTLMVRVELSFLEFLKLIYSDNDSVGRFKKKKKKKEDSSDSSCSQKGFQRITIILLEMQWMM